jgi:protein-L-isoaspartate(D-aspartate) O-methyltransferase
MPDWQPVAARENRRSERLRGPCARVYRRPSALGRAAALAASWRNGYAEDCKSLHPGSIPGEASIAVGRMRLNRAAPGGARRWGKPLPSPDTAAQRRNMVDTQLRTYDVTSHRLLDAMESVPREVFAPDHMKSLAYTDQEIVVSAGEGTVRPLLQPMVLGRLLQALEVKAGETALDCAGGSGYGAALLASLGAAVSALEDSESMAALMRDRLAAAGVINVEVLAGDLATGDPARGSFDVILVHGAAETAPDGLLARLSDGGRLGIVMGTGRAGRAVVFTRSGDVIGRRTVFDAAARPLMAFSGVPAFRF